MEVDGGEVGDDGFMSGVGELDISLRFICTVQYGRLVMSLG